MGAADFDLSPIDAWVLSTGGEKGAEASCSSRTEP